MPPEEMLLLRFTGLSFFCGRRAFEFKFKDLFSSRNFLNFSAAVFSLLLLKFLIKNVLIGTLLGPWGLQEDRTAWDKPCTLHSTTVLLALFNRAVRLPFSKECLAGKSLNDKWPMV